MKIEELSRKHLDQLNLDHFLFEADLYHIEYNEIKSFLYLIEIDDLKCHILFFIAKKNYFPNYLLDQQLNRVESRIISIIITDIIQSHSYISSQFIDKYENYIDFDQILVFHNVGEEFMEKHIDKMNWKIVFKKYNISNSFIDRNADKIDWIYLCKCETLSEEFIEKYKERVIWNIISKHQPLSESFVKKWEHRINWFSYFQNENAIASENFLKEKTAKLNDDEKMILSSISMKNE